MTGVVVDASAVVAILLEEPNAERLTEEMNDADELFLSAVTLVEASIVMESRAPLVGAEGVQSFVRYAEVQIVDVDRTQTDSAIDAWRRFGTGRHAAALNFGDCFVYALAEEMGYPILCVGNDFAQTDLEVLPSR